jgi:sirohydrochlorin ferrochelatase
MESRERQPKHADNTDQTTEPSAQKRALIVVDHGSRRRQANDLLHTVVSQLVDESKGAYLTVEPAHMELAEPTLEMAFSRCLEAGATEIVVCLFFLSPGRHATGDIPRMIQELMEQHPGVRVSMTAPLAPDKRLAALLLARAEEATATWG